MLVQVDFYNKNGKWKYGGEVELTTDSWDSQVLNDLITRQDIVVNCKDYYIVVNDLPESFADRNYRITYNRLYTIDQVNTMIRMMKI